MEKIINFNYNTNINKVIQVDNYYHFEHDNSDYFFVYFNKSLDDLLDIMTVSGEIRKRGIYTHDIVLNKDKQPITKINDNSYVLLKINGNPKETFDIYNVLDINDQLILVNNKSKLYRNDWENLWSKKIDYFEYQVRELGKNKRIILDSFTYYVGLAENAIAYVNKTTTALKAQQLDRLTLCHRRIFCPNYRITFLNPLSFIFDLEVRDIAEYFKAKFFADEDVWPEVKIYFEKRKLSIYGYQMFFARLLYPSYYFDVFEKVMERNLNEDSLVSIINKVDKYETFLYRMYNYLKTFAPIEEVSWIIKNRD